MNVVDIIAKKRDGGELTTDEIRFFVAGVTEGSIPDYQASAWMMAVFLRGMCRRETLDLTLAMRDSGDIIDLSDLTSGPALDKHSTGGVGDKTSLVVIPILAAAGVPILKMSGRGLGFSGGTVDKLESIPGFRTDLSIVEAREIVKRVGAVMIGQSSRLAPADKILYALRDVTATIESTPLIASSIMSKKLAAGGQRILLDVKCGQGAFMKTRDRAELLALELVAIGNGAGVPTVAVLSAMDEPLGCTVGNALEVREAIETMQSRALFPLHPPYPVGSTACIPANRQAAAEDLGENTTRRRGGDNARGSGEGTEPVPDSSLCSPCSLFLNLCLDLASQGLVSVGKALSLEHGREQALGLVKTGTALKKLVDIVSAQGGPGSAGEIMASLPVAAETRNVNAQVGGNVVSVDAEAIGRLAVEIGGGRLKKGDPIDHSVGIVLHCKTGSPVLPGIPVATLHLRELDAGRADELADKLRAAFKITGRAPRVPDSLVLGVIR